MKIQHQEDYSKKREAEYPPLSDFVDAFYWSQNGDPSKMQAYLAAVKAVKARYPKPAK